MSDLDRVSAGARALVRVPASSANLGPAFDAAGLALTLYDDVEVQVLADGSVGQADILQTSGFRRLDEAAVKGALQTAFTPAIRMGRPVASTTRLSYTFRLTDD